VSEAEFPYEAEDRVEALIETLTKLQAKDPDQEVHGIAVPVLDAVIEAIKADIGRDNPVVAATAGVISPDLIASGDPIRAADALLVAEMLNAEIGPTPWIPPGIA